MANGITNKTGSSSIGTGSGSATATVSLTHEQIEERAKSIWIKRGYPAGKDQKIWSEAEAQLKKETGAK